jgi:hypothetical protein
MTGISPKHDMHVSPWHVVFVLKSDISFRVHDGPSPSVSFKFRPKIATVERSEQGFYRWKSKFGVINVSQAITKNHLGMICPLYKAAKSLCEFTYGLFNH